jgi:hypothetical protein
LKPFAGFIAVLEKLEDLRLARQAMPALEEWQSDLSTARLLQEVSTEPGNEI